jgi:hypothetical protein
MSKLQGQMLKYGTKVRNGFITNGGIIKKDPPKKGIVAKVLGIFKKKS